MGCDDEMRGSGVWNETMNWSDGEADLNNSGKGYFNVPNYF